MNHKIYELARRADQLAREQIDDLREIPLYNRLRDEIFAELIIKETIATMEPEVHLALRETELLEHFGL